MLSVVLPCFNESEALEAFLPELLGQLATLTMPFEIVVVDDGSTDGSADVARRLVSRHPQLKVVQHVANRGYAAALSTGVEASAGGTVLLMDADGQFSAGDIPRFLSLLEGHDGVVGYRRHRRDGILRRALSAGYNSLARWALNIGFLDANCAFKLLRRPATDIFPLQTRGFLAGSEILARCQIRGSRLAETWVTHHPRRGGASTVRPHHVLEALRELARLRRNLRKRRTARAWSTDRRPRRPR